MTQLSASDRKSVRAAEKASRQIQRQDDDFLAFIMSSVEGRRWMHGFLARCKIGINAFSPDALVTAFQCGEQNVGNSYWSDLMRVCPDSYVEMMREVNGRDKPSSDDDATFNYTNDDGSGYGADLYDNE